MCRAALLCLVFAACGSKGPPANLPVLPDDNSGSATPPPVAQAPKREDWAGTLVLPHALTDIVVHFVETDGTWTATLDVPGKVTAIPLSNVTYTASAIRFTIEKSEAPQANELYSYQRQGDAATGKLVIGGQPFHTKMIRLNPDQPPLSVISRPQTPKEPFPYRAKDVVIESGKDAKLAGTLTVPEGKGPFPAVVLISGSGQQDRDETIFGHKPFAVIADRLTRDGVAVLRTDDRGMGSTTGPLGSLDTDIADARAAFEWLRTQKEIDPKRVGLLGHSIGGVIAPIVAQRTGKAAFVIGLAAPGVSGVELVPMQLEVDLALRKLPEPLIKAIVEGQRKVGKAIASGKDAEIRAALKESFASAAIAMGAPRPADAELDKAVEGKMPEVTNPWTVSFFKTDPAPAWQKLRIPVLLLIGDKDTQVPADANLARITAALNKAGNKDVTAEKRAGLNHLYQHATLGTMDEYGEIEETFDPATLDLLAKWVVARARVR